MLQKGSQIVFICTAIAGIGLRVYLKLVTIDPATGFYEGNLFPATVLHLLLAVGVIALLVLGFLKQPAKKLSGGMPLRVLAFLTGVSALIVVGLESLAILDNLGGASVSSALVGLFFQLCGAASGFVFIAIALLMRPDGSCRINATLLLFPLVWQIYRLLTCFMAYTAIRSVSDQLLAVLTMVLLAPFLLAHGRVLGKVGSEKGMCQLAAFGLPFALLALTSSIGVIIAFFAGRAVTIATDLPQAVFYLLMGAYAAVLSLSTHEAAPKAS